VILTPRQQDVLDFIKGYVDENQYPPTMSEIAAGIGVASKSVAFTHLQALRQKGAIEIGGGPRTLRVVS
jgi:repressor LexA